jgi:hypothetical protein
MATKVNYARLYNLGNYENERIEIEADVAPDESPAEVLRRLADWVEVNAENLIKERQAKRMEARKAREQQDEPNF